MGDKKKKFKKVARSASSDTFFKKLRTSFAGKDRKETNSLVQRIRKK